MRFPDGRKRIGGRSPVPNPPPDGQFPLKFDNSRGRICLMHLTREKICELTSHKLAAAAGSLPKLKATVGLDGFVDEIIAVVDKRRSHEHYDPIRTIDVLGRKIGAAAGESSN